MGKKNNKTKTCEKGGYLVRVKILYNNGNYLYANFFKKKVYDYGVKHGSIIGYKPMNWLERLIFKHCQ